MVLLLYNFKDLDSMNRHCKLLVYGQGDIKNIKKLSIKDAFQSFVEKFRHLKTLKKWI